MSLSKKQFLAVNELFEQNGDEKKVLEKFNISVKDWLKWNSEPEFLNEISRKINHQELQTKIIAAKYKPLILVKLIKLSEDESSETSRKSCKDFLEIVFPKEELMPVVDNPAAAEKFTLETQSKLLELLANDPLAVKRTKERSEKMDSFGSGAEYDIGDENAEHED
jgi:hypothetical protein